MSNEPFARFYYQAEKDKPASKEAGREIFKQVPYLKVVHPGRKDYELVTSATDEHKKRYPKAWEAFLEAEKEPESGTPLKMVPIMTVDAIAFLKAIDVKTLEAFAGLQKDDVQGLPTDIQELHKRAQLYLEAASDKGALANKFAQAQKEVDALSEDLKEARATIADLKKEVATLTKLVDGKTAPPKAKAS